MADENKIITTWTLPDCGLNQEFFQQTGEHRFLNGVLQYCMRGSQGTIRWNDVPHVTSVLKGENL